MKNIVLICCDNNYVPKSIIALNLFYSYNPGYTKVIIGTSFTDKSKSLCEEYNIQLVEINLSNDFIKLNERPYGKQYPIECFYHFYAYKIFYDYNFIIQLEPDMYTNKKINIDLNSVKYIGGSYAKDTNINNFGPLMKDYNNIKKVYGAGNINQPRILGGVKIYNVKGLKEIKFYEKIIEYYKTSLKIGAPRCGDDSLMVMYQLLNPSHIKLLQPLFHIIFFNNINLNFRNIIFFHFGGPTPKYWSVKDDKNLQNIQKYFYNNMIEYIYNNFTTEFIKEYLPEIYIDISNVKIPFYYYNENNNFGDLITPYFLNKYCGNNSYEFSFNDNTAKIISCGSIMRLCNENTIVYGSGIRDIDQNINKGIIQFVRGPLTRERLLKIGCYCPPVYGDPGLLLPLYYKPNINKTHKLGIIPHYIHYDIVSKMYKNSNKIKIINLMNDNIELVINEILSCEKIISSSLHGLIVSDAYKIPNKWVKFNNKINGDDTKFYDYFKSVDRRDTLYIDCMNYKNIPENTYNLIKNVNINFDINFLHNKFFMNKNGIRNYTKYLYLKMLNNKGSIVINTKTPKKPKLLNNQYLAFKSHWKLSKNKLISTQETFLKKNQLHSSKLENKYKIKIPKNKEIIYIKDFNTNYYLIAV